MIQRWSPMNKRLPVASPPLEVLRQLLGQGALYDRAGKFLKDIHGQPVSRFTSLDISIYFCLCKDSLKNFVYLRSFLLL